MIFDFYLFDMFLLSDVEKSDLKGSTIPTYLCSIHKGNIEEITIFFKFKYVFVLPRLIFTAMPCFNSQSTCAMLKLARSYEMNLCS